MGRYIAKRLFMTIFVVLATAVMIFTIMYFIPGDPAKILLGSEATPEQILAERIALGLEDPYLVQLGRFMYNTFIRFDLGTSWFRGTSVAADIAERLPRTLKIGVTAIIISSLAAIPLGITAAVHRNQWQDHVASVFAMICISIPDFWLSLMMIILFSLKLGWLPSFGVGGPEYYIMPIIAASIHGVGTLTRQTRSSMLEVINSDFVTTARAKGQTEKKIIWKHILPNGLIPVITVIGGSFGHCIAGTVIIEQIFSIPGMGRLAFEAMLSRDYPVVMGILTTSALLTLVGLIISDILYAIVDPRIRFE